MIKLINNEYRKIGKYKVVLSQLIFLIIILIIKESGNNIEKYLLRLIPFIGIISFIFLGGIISNERENGTLRFYLTKPIKRWKIYLSKFLTIVLYLLLLIGFVLGIYFIISRRIDSLFLLKYLKYTIPLFLMGSIMLLLSNIFKSTSIVVGISIFVLSFGLLLSQLLFDVNLNFIEYTFLPYLDYSIFDDTLILTEINDTYDINLNINKGILINAIYMLFFYLIGSFYFSKKDIKN